MADDKPEIIFQIPPQQKRLRILTGLILLTDIIMVVLGVFHPFFHIPPPVALTPTMRKAYLFKGIFILSWWVLCLILTFIIFLMVWLDLRTVQLHVRMAKREIIRRMASERKEHPNE